MGGGGPKVPPVALFPGPGPGGVRTRYPPSARVGPGGGRAGVRNAGEGVGVERVGG